jgi:ABC-type sugar transport system substrate-binding protein
MSRRAATLVLVALCGAAAGCGGKDHSVVSKPPTPSIVAVIKGLDNPFFASMRDGLVSTAAREGAPLRVDAAADVNDAAGQASRLESDESESKGCYIVSPVNTTNLIGPLSKRAPQTPVVNIDLPIAQQQAAALGVHISTFITTNNAAAGAAAARAMASLVPRGGLVALLTGPSGDANSQARIDGFRKGSAGRFRVVATAAADWDRGKAQRATAVLLASETGLDGIFAANDLMALGSATAVEAAGRRGDVAVVGVDGIREALRAVASGKLSATVAQYPHTMGQLGVEACVAVARGKKIPARIDAPLQLVVKSNVAEVERSFPKPLEAFDDPLAKLLNK